MARDRTLGLKLKALDRMSTVIDRVQGKFPKLAKSIRRASLVTKAFNAQTKRMRAMMKKIGDGMQSFGRSLTTFVTLPILAAGAAGVKMFGDFEQGLKGIEKTTGLAGPALEKLGARFDKLSTEMPVTTAEMLEIAQAGGQLGIKGAKNLEKFTTVMAKLSRASDVAGEDGAKAISRILTVTGDGIQKVDRFSAALVDLGNNAAASESEILEVATRVSGQIGRFDVGSASVLGISTALKAMGKNAEAAGSVVGRGFDSIDQAIRGGGKEMKILSKLTGIAGKDLKKEFKTNAAGVFRKFIEGLGKVEKGGGNVTAILAAMGLQGVRINDILGTLAKRPEVLAENMDRATAAFQKNAALNKEFAVQTATFNSAMTTLMNTFTSLLRLIGKDLAPIVLFFGKILKGIFNFLRENPAIRRLVIVFGALAAVLGPILVVLGGFIAILPSLIAGFAALGVATFPITGTVLAIGAAIAGLIAIVTVMISKWDEFVAFMDRNPFTSLIKSAILLLNPIGMIITGVKLIISAFKGVDAVKNTLRDALPSFVGDAVFGSRAEARELARNAGQGPLQQFQDAQSQQKGIIDVNFANLPEGSNVRSTSDGPLDLNLGFAGGFQ